MPRCHATSPGQATLISPVQLATVHEPFFSDRSDFDREDELAATGVTPLLHYDAFGRLVRTDFPDGTVSRIEIAAWRTVAYDQNDTVLEGAWFAERMAPGADAADRRAAELSAAHANTPSVAHADSLGRAVLTDVHDVAEGVEVHAITRQVLDIEGNVLQVVDARGNVAESRVFGMGGAVFVVDSVDAGWRRMLVDVAAAPLRGWNARGFASRARYDALRRATHAFVMASGGVEMLVARTVFGESVPGAEASNLRGRAYRVYDGAGVVTHERFDFAGNLRRQSRRLARGFEATQDWTALEEAVPATIEGIAAAAEPALEAETFAVESEYDALGRVIASTTPDQSVTLSAYNEAGLLDSVAVRLRGAVTPTSFVSDLDYNARGQRQRCVHGNGTVTTYEYDARTFRLARLRLVREGDSAVLQDLRYTYDGFGSLPELMRKVRVLGEFGTEPDRQVAVQTTQRRMSRDSDDDRGSRPLQAPCGRTRRCGGSRRDADEAESACARHVAGGGGDRGRDREGGVQRDG